MKKMDSEMQRWIELHAADDPVRLRLRHHGDEELAFAITQIECRRKAGNRFPVALASHEFMFPTDLSAEQATSEALARIHADIADYQSGSTHLDLTCGLGMDAFEAARRGARVTAIDINPEVADAARHNAEALGLSDGLEVVCGDSASWIRDTGRRFDTIFIDPARRGQGGRRLTAIAECSPDVTALMPQLLRLAPEIIIKASPMLDLTALASELNAACGTKGGVTRMIAIGTTRECKEVVAVIGRQAAYHYRTEAITALPDRATPSIFQPATDLPQAPVLQGLPAIGEYLYEPYPAVMKTAAWGALAALSTSLRQLHHNTHLFVADSEVNDFPGTPMRIERVEQLSDKALKSIPREWPKINVATRNFIISAPELAKRLRIKEGGIARLYGVRSGASGTLALIVAVPV